MGKKDKNHTPYGLIKRIERKPKQLGEGSKDGRPETWTPERIANEGRALIEWLNESEENYYLTEFAGLRGYPSCWLDGLCQKDTNFSLTLHRAREVMESRIVKASLNREMDGNFAKFVLANKAGWRERQEISGSKEDPLSNILINIDGRTKEIVEEIDGEQVK